MPLQDMDALVKSPASELLQSRVKIEIWDGDLVRLWGSYQEADYAVATMS